MTAEELALKKAQLISIKTAYTSGVLTVKHGDTLTTFRTLSEMKQIIADLEGEISEAENGKPKRGPGYIRQEPR